MSRILLAWELGGNYGHLSILLPIARHLRQHGHEIFFAVKNLVTAENLLKEEDFRYIQAPRSFSCKNRFHKPASFADILAGAGFCSPEVLAGLVKSWHRIFTAFQPDVVVSQYAPVAQFAARLACLPCLQLNTGFECPPDVAPYPSFRPYLRLTQEHLLAKEMALLVNLNLVSSGNGFLPYQNLQEALKADIDLLVTLPELDHYRGRRNGHFIGPISILDDGGAIKWTGGMDPRIFVYLRPFSGIEAVLKTLEKCDAEVIACMPGIDDRLSASFTSKSLCIFSSRVRLSGLLAETDLVISHAGHGTTAAAFLAGVPMLTIPTTVEQWLMSRNMACLGVGVGVGRERIADEFPRALRRLIADRTYRERAEMLSKKYAGYDQRRVVERIANTIERLPKWAGNRRKGDSEVS